MHLLTLIMFTTLPELLTKYCQRDGGELLPRKDDYRRRLRKEERERERQTNR